MATQPFIWTGHVLHTAQSDFLLLVLQENTFTLSAVRKKSDRTHLSVDLSQFVSTRIEFRKFFSWCG